MQDANNLGEIRMDRMQNERQKKRSALDSSCEPSKRVRN